MLLQIMCNEFIMKCSLILYQRSFLDTVVKKVSAKMNIGIKIKKQITGG